MSVRSIPDVLLDVSTQRDYLAPYGAHRVPNADHIAGPIKHLMAYARWAHLPTLSCVDVWRPSEVCGVAQPFCVSGTLGQRKIAHTLLPNHLLIESDNCLCIPLDVFEQHQQVILIKRHRDPFTNPKLDRLLTELPVRRFVIFGVGLETSLRLLVLGLLLRHRQVLLIQDACGHWSADEAEMTRRQLEAKNCAMMSAAEFIAAKRKTFEHWRRAAGRRRRSVA